MKNLKIFLISLIFILPFSVFSPASAELKMMLKNGSSIIAESCTETGGKFVCSKMGGTFDIEKIDVAEIKEIPVEKQSPNDFPPPIPEPEINNDTLPLPPPPPLPPMLKPEPKGNQEEIKNDIPPMPTPPPSIPKPEPKGNQEEIKKPASDAKDSAKPDAGVLIKGANPEAEKRLDQITKRKIDLKTDRDNLIKEREQLHEDAKNAGVVRTQEQLDAFKKRIADLENRINTFNDEVKNLNDEENKIIESLKK